MRVLAIDPGLGVAGYAFVDFEQEGYRRISDYGVITTPKGHSLEKRLSILYQDCESIIRNETFRAFYYERPILRGATTASMVMAATGVILCVVGKTNVPVTALAPCEVKAFVSGNGRASKAGVRESLETVWGISFPRGTYDDAIDAVAIAIAGYLGKERFNDSPTGNARVIR